MHTARRRRSVLGRLPDMIKVEASGNIIKNVKSVVVPNTGGRCGIPTAAAIGVLGGNQGMTASLPVIEYAEELKVSRETLYRALLISNLITLHAKNGIGIQRHPVFQNPGEIFVGGDNVRQVAAGQSGIIVLL